MQTNTKKFLTHLKMKGCTLFLGRWDGSFYFKNIDHFLEAPPDQRLHACYNGGITTKKMGRASDADIIKQKAVVFDLDLRKEWCESEEFRNKLQKWCGDNLTDEHLKVLFPATFIKALSGTKFRNPNVITFTGNGLHLVYLAENEIDVEGRIDDWKRNYKRLARELGDILKLGRHIGIIDVSCGNPSKVFRCPEAYNNKLWREVDGTWQSYYSDNEKEWKKAEIVVYDESFWHDELLNSMLDESSGEDYFEEVRKNDGDNLFTEKTDWFIDRVYPELPWWYWVRRLNIKKCLEVLSGKPEVHGELFRFRAKAGGGWVIEVKPMNQDAYKACNAWIDPFGRIGSPEGGPYLYSWLMYYKQRSEGEAMDIIYKYFGSLLPPRTGKADEISEVKWESNGLVDDLFNNPVARYDWGMHGVTHLFPALQAKRLVVIAAQGGMGKTTWAFQMALQNALNGRKVAFLSLEMDVRSLLLREVANRVGAEEALRSGNLIELKKYEKELKACGEYVQVAGIRFFEPDYMADKDISNIDKMMAFIRANNDLEIIIVDNLIFIEADNTESEYDKYAYVVHEFKKIVTIENKCIVLLHHLRKGQNKRGDRELDDLSGNSVLANKADIVAFLTERERPKTDEEKTAVKMGSPGFTGEGGEALQKMVCIEKDRYTNRKQKLQIKMVKGELMTIFHNIY